MSFKFHDLRHLSMSEAYDQTQCDADIKSGDVLYTTDGVAILDGAWPVMIQDKSEVFHMVKPECLDSWVKKYLPQIQSVTA